MSKSETKQMNIYVSNLSFDITDAELAQLFEAHGRVDKASVIKDRDTGRSRGFGFVEMSEKAEAEAAIQAMNGKEIKGRALNVNEARPKPQGAGGGGGGRGGRSGGGNRW